MQPPVSKLLLWVSWAGLAWERFWPEFWAIVAFLGAIAALVLLGALPIGPVWLQQIIWGGAILLTISSICRASRALNWPRRGAAMRRIETASGLAHRPLSQFGDSLAEGRDDALKLALWAAHQRRQARLRAPLTVPWPDTRIVERDPYAIRAGIVIALVVGFVIAGPSAPDRLWRAISFPQGLAAIGPEVAAELWFTPPDYTGLAPVYVSSAAPSPSVLAVPMGSRLLVQVHGATTVPIVSLDGLRRSLAASGDRDYTLSLAVPKITHLDLQIDGVETISLPIRWIPDLPPQVVWTHPPRRTLHGAIDLRYQATDDYGVTALDLAVTPAPGLEAAPGNGPTAIRHIALPSPPARQVASEAFEDLTDSPWAGLPVSLHLIAHDAIGQRGESPSMTMILPERVFRNPVAQAIVAARKALAQHPGNAHAIAEAISAISLKPEEYRNDLRVFLALRVAARQLAGDASPPSRDSVGTLLWRAAIRVEDGAAGQAEINVRSAEKALRDALARHASANEIHTLMQQLRQAISQYLQTMMQNGQARAQPNTNVGNGKTISAAQIDALLQRAEALAKIGDQAGADAVMAQLQRLMESLEFGSADDGAKSDSLRDLSALARDQQRLLDQSLQNQAGTPQPTPGASAQPSNAAKDQEALRQRLYGLSHQLGSDALTPTSDLDRAGRAMSAAAKSLRAGDGPGAISSQNAAVTALRAAVESLAKTLQGQAGSGGGAEMSEDPLGRPNDQGKSLQGEDIAIPTDPTITRSRHILDELRRRQGDLERPQLERDYIDRLLQDF